LFGFVNAMLDRAMILQEKSHKSTILHYIDRRKVKKKMNLELLI
jgi:hypothetical protein